MTAWWGRRFIRVIVALACIAMGGASVCPGATASSALDLPGCRDNSLFRNDDESSGSLDLPFAIDFYGSTYESLYLNNNGNVTFDSPLGTYVPFDLTETNRVIIAPFFADVDTRPIDGGTVTYGETTFEGRPAFCALWDDVGYYPNQTDKRNTFQLLIVRGTPGTGDFDIVFRYASLQWELGSASDGVSAHAGFSNGQPANSVELTGSGENGAFLDGGPHALAQGSIGSTTPGTWVFHIRGGTAGNDPRNVPPGFARSTAWWTWPDRDGDGLPDYWEQNGVWVGEHHVDLPGLGADVNQKDAFIYVDLVKGERWNPTIESTLRSSFRKAPLGIDLHIVRGGRTLSRTEVPSSVSASDAFFGHMVRLGFTDTGLSGAPGSVPALAKYVCVCPDHVKGGGVGGEANGIKADHLVVTVYEAKWLDDIKAETGISFPNNDLVGDRLNAIATMHELGHLYGLKHHGAEDLPFGDPSYRSIMSYAYNAFGVPRPADEAIATGDLLPRIDYSRDTAVNYDWRMGGGFGQLSLVYGQHGERGSFYTSVDDIPSGSEDAPPELGIDEMLADPQLREEIKRGAREVAAALETDGESQGASASEATPVAHSSHAAIHIDRLALRRRAVIVSMRCTGESTCSGSLRIAIARHQRHRRHESRHRRRHQKRRGLLVIGRSNFLLAGGTRRVIKVKLTRTGRQRVHSTRNGRLALIVWGTGLKRRVVGLRTPKRRHPPKRPRS